MKAAPQAIVEQPTAPVLRLFAVPATGDTVYTPPPVRALHQAFALPPGCTLAVTGAATPTAAPDRWEVFTDAYNLTYLSCARTGAVAYFAHDDATFYFTAYYGSTASILHDFYLAAYRVPLVAVPGAAAEDVLPLTVLRRPWLKFLQDVVAPFGQFVKPTFTLAGLDAASAGTQAAVVLCSTVAVRAWGRSTVLRTAEITVQEGRLAALRVAVGGGVRTFIITPAA